MNEHEERVLAAMIAKHGLIGALASIWMIRARQPFSIKKAGAVAALVGSATKAMGLW